MTPANDNEQTESAISAGMARGDTDAWMRAGANSDVVVPQADRPPGGEAPEGSPSAPVNAPDGTAYRDVVAPQADSPPGEEAPEGSLSLPVIEQDGTSCVPVFTSEATMNSAAPELEDAVAVSAAELGANWPSDDLWLAVNPRTEDG